MSCRCIQQQGREQDGIARDPCWLKLALPLLSKACRGRLAMCITASINPNMPMQLAWPNHWTYDTCVLLRSTIDSIMLHQGLQQGRPRLEASQLLAACTGRKQGCTAAFMRGSVILGVHRYPICTLQCHAAHFMSNTVLTACCMLGKPEAYWAAAAASCSAVLTSATEEGDVESKPSALQYTFVFTSDTGA